NGEDEDCDGRIDCRDAECRQQGACLCTQSLPEDCSDFIDNDCDGWVDCADPSCFSSSACADCTVEDCDSGADEDCNGLIDCSDPACFFAPNCEARPEQCNNDIDDDHDFTIDCEDLDCQNNPLCVQEQGNCFTAKLIAGNMSSQHFGDTTGHSNLEQGSCGGDAGEAVFELLLNEPARV